MAADRGTGRTTKQMQDAPRGAVFVWCNGLTDYPRRLARHIGRGDLKIEQADVPEHRLRGFAPGHVVYDHAWR